jgi:lambda family phage portal protein
MEFNPGMVFDDLLPGESVEMVGSARPNTGLEEFRNSQLRAIASGTGTSYSGISRNYNGTYSSQRQELVESWVGYELMREYLYGAFYLPVWQRFVRMAFAAGLVDKASIDLATLFDVDFVGPKMPWIDPVKEVEANVKAIDAGLTSRHMVIRESQLDPALVDQQITADKLRAKLKAEANPPAPAPAAKPKPETDEEDAAAAAA